MSEQTPAIVAFGEAALLVRYRETMTPQINRLVHVLAARLRDELAAGSPWGPPVPGYSSLLVPFDPLRISGAEAEARLRRLLEYVMPEPAPAESLPPLEIPVRYGDDDGPDLADVADRTGMTPADVVALHTAPTYRAYLLGFAPGFAYLGALPRGLQLPRRASPRQRVPPGSVAIAGAQTAVYPLATPGGWHIIGRTDIGLWDLDRDPPALIQPGRQVRFVADDR